MQEDNEGIWLKSQLMSTNAGQISNWQEMATIYYDPCVCVCKTTDNSCPPRQHLRHGLHCA